ncbi:VWA domain-containing protein [Chthonobacter rhizosphaerae]|uniref:VWA domain-containing protein n=1 Tax=Chthonobacter rhizosphaerae TaxID=2735553 RepID=UPI0015EF112E|nr:VWA domain-containing protein [Chthonobacter rhizosphaerae]
MEWFASPLALLLAPLPLLAARFLPPRPAAAAAVVVPDAIAATLGSGEAAAARRDRTHRLLAWAAWLALVVAIAGPQRVLPSPALPATGREIVLVLDLSGSMEAKDFQLNGQPVRRIDAVKAVSADFLRGRAGDRVGLVFFAEQAEVAAVPTFDVAAVAEAMETAAIGDLGRSTAIGDGLGLAIKRLRDSTAPSRVVVLLSDGTSTAGAVRAETAAELARGLGIKVHTIALGTTETLAGSEGAGSLVDAATLEAIASVSGGSFFRVRSTDDLKAVTSAIDALEGGRAAAPSVAVAVSLWPWPAGAAVLLLAALFVFDRRRP